MAGVDVDLGGDAYTNLCHAVQSGQMDKTVIDTAVCRVLRMKFEMGLFEHPYVDPKIAAKQYAVKNISNWHVKSHSLP